MTRIFAKHLPYEDGRLGEVGLYMDYAGAPTITAMMIGGSLFALEGSHRLAQAHYRGIIPKIIILEPDIQAYGRPAPINLPQYEFPYVLALFEENFQ